MMDDFGFDHPYESEGDDEAEAQFNRAHRDDPYDPGEEDSGYEELRRGQLEDDDVDLDQDFSDEDEEEILESDYEELDFDEDD